MKLLYYPGCTLKTTAKNFEDSAIASFNALGVELKELQRWNCCGTVCSLTTDDLMHHRASVRNLIRVKEEGENKVATFCSMCYNTLKQSNIRIKNNISEREKINDFMDTEKIKYGGEVSVLHGLEILRDEIGFNKISEKVKRPLKGLKIAPYYGCLLLRPLEVGIDNPDNPSVLENLITSLGGEVIDFPYKNECCGAYQTVNEVEIVVDKAYEMLSYAQSMGAELILTSCPLCEFNLDSRQKEVKKRYPQFKELPAMYFTQVMAVAFDLPKETYRFDLNYVKCKWLSS
ncbi:MAG: CoB--CoM heterodisulfide reductase iron-sulfur subunit B family protein [Candidatus Stahlbacteria bacterium]|nr:CoB--CoM heterodisulfide reductase iron-sulfur subunit B family protein [Candidatus Stahlbacteria bacterium]